MPSSDYKAAVGGGLKLKGAKSAGIDKSKKKKKPKTTPIESTQEAEASPASGIKDEGESTSVAKVEDTDEAEAEAAAWSTATTLENVQDDGAKGFGKTEAQRRHEEMKRKRLDERLKREGIKTHKERVEELNKYLSGLSEHHDMPRIGPG